MAIETIFTFEINTTQETAANAGGWIQLFGIGSSTPSPIYMPESGKEIGGFHNDGIKTTLYVVSDDPLSPTAGEIAGAEIIRQGGGESYTYLTTAPDFVFTAAGAGAFNPATYRWDQDNTVPIFIADTYTVNLLGDVVTGSFNTPDEWAVAQTGGIWPAHAAWATIWDAAGIPSGQFNKRLYLWLISLGYEGCLTEMMYEWVIDNL